MSTEFPNSTAQNSTPSGVVTQTINGVQVSNISFDTDGSPLMTLRDSTGGNAMGLSRSQAGTATFASATTVVVTFSPAFKRIPRITITRKSNTATQPFVSTVSATALTIQFAAATTASLDWSADERG